MTLNWRLKELPTGDEVAQLVEQKVITQKEARDILFKESSDTKVNELEEEIKFLRDLCDKLVSKNKDSWITVVKEYQRYTPVYPTWYSTYGGVINTGPTAYTSSTLPRNVTGSVNKSLSSLN